MKWLKSRKKRLLSWLESLSLELLKELLKQLLLHLLKNLLLLSLKLPLPKGLKNRALLKLLSL